MRRVQFNLISDFFCWAAEAGGRKLPASGRSARSEGRGEGPERAELTFLHHTPTFTLRHHPQPDLRVTALAPSATRDLTTLPVSPCLTTVVWCRGERVGGPGKCELELTTSLVSPGVMCLPFCALSQCCNCPSSRGVDSTALSPCSE